MKLYRVVMSKEKQKVKFQPSNLGFEKEFGARDKNASTA